ncbi:MAG: transposase [Betaproteobacteria bacterium RIFCSPLOWO2_12_FULL_68_19]|nr:MAG: transposase [Betaproteobacteria bacterium RIFCSPLOWO2_12_FULL_68_19]
MPRRARIILGGLPVHIVQRGNNRAPCFFEDQDRYFYLFHLGRLLPRARCSLHAYCLMTNHVHLLVTPAEPVGCAQLMKYLGQLHTQYVNRHYGRSGTLWEGRFKSCIVQSEDYLLSCYRYIELNPVRGGLCDHPAKYLWSSYRVNAEGVPAALVTPHAEFQRLGVSDEERRSAYTALFASNLDAKRVDDIRSATNGNFALGDESFKRQLGASLGRRVERGSPGRPASTQEKRGLSLI